MTAVLLPTLDRLPLPGNPVVTELPGFGIPLHEREIRRLERERDALADQVGRDFEELHWLRKLAGTLTTTDATTELNTVANNVLPSLRSLLRAEMVILVLSDSTHRGSRGESNTPEIRLIRHGHASIDGTELRRLVQQLDGLPGHAPVVLNRDSHMHPVVLETTARNVVAAPLLQCQTRYGWLIGLNRIAAPGVSDEFGSHEAGLLTMAAGMLASHARNVELFRAEESLRVSVIETITGALDARDPYTCGHSRRVGELAMSVAARCGFTAEQRERIYLTGLLHDVGKIGIPDDILKKPGKLTTEEFDVIKQHPAIGHSILLPLKGLAFALDGVLHHHERVDGGGYPHGLSGEDIPLDARILAVVDSYDAMTTNRAYRQAMTASQAVEILRQGADTQWDRHVVDAFKEAHGMLSVGLCAC